MKNLTLYNFEANLSSVMLNDVLGGDELVCVDCGSKGAVVLLSEDEYSVLSEAFRAIFAVAGSVEADGNTIDVKKLLEKLGEQK